MEMQQMMEMLLKEIKAGQEQMVTKLDANMKSYQEKTEANLKKNQEDFMAKLDADRKAAQAKADANRVQMQELMKMMDAYQAKTDAVLLAMQVMDTSHKETATVIEPETEVKMMACQEMEAHQEEEEPTSADRKPEAAEEYEKTPQ
jgi:hypothetical protein